MHKFAFLLLLIGVTASAVASETGYERKPGVAGNITSVGSDTLANLMTLWSQEFKTLYPDVTFQFRSN